MTSVGFEPAIPVREDQQTHVLERTAIGIHVNPYPANVENRVSS